MITSEAMFSVYQPLVGVDPQADQPTEKLRSRTAKGDRKTPRKRLRQGMPAEDQGSFVEDEAGEVAQKRERGQQDNVDDGRSANVQDTLEGQKHIHPCICDLSAAQRKRIRTYLKEKATLQKKYESRLDQIEAELQRIEEEQIAKERELVEQQELFGDEYEMIGRKKKRKKRSARRASMVSLGVKQVIDWRKPPRYPTKQNKTSNLRRQYTSYCGRSLYPESSIEKIDYSKDPIVRVRSTKSFQLRSKVNLQKKTELINSEDKRQRFITCCF